MTRFPLFLQIPSGSQPSSSDGSIMDYATEDSKFNKWNTFIVNLNGIKNGFKNGIAKNGSAKSGIATIIPKENMNTPLSPPYIVAPSFEMRWPNNFVNGTNGSAVQIPAFRLISHKQLEHADQIEPMEADSDESPPYLPVSTSTRPLGTFHEGSRNLSSAHSNKDVIEKPV